VSDVPQPEGREAMSDELSQAMWLVIALISGAALTLGLLDWIELRRRR
jgi:hypothetical protein